MSENLPSLHQQKQALDRWAEDRSRALKEIRALPPDPDDPSPPPPPKLPSSLFQSPDTNTPAPDLTPFEGPDLPLDHNGEVDQVELKKKEKFLRRRAFERAFAEARYTLEDLYPFRLIAAWRITRHMGRVRGILHKDTMLAQALAAADDLDGGDAWTRPTPLSLYRATSDSPSYAIEQILEPIRLAEALPRDDQGAYEITRHREAMALLPMPGLGFVPPPVPMACRRATGEIRSDYDPAEDQNLGYFLHAAGACATQVCLARGSKADPDLGRYGMYGLLDPIYCRVAWPSPMAIMQWEHTVVEQTLDLMVDESTARVRRDLADKLGLTPYEVNSAMAMARSLAERSMAGSIEEAKAMMLLRLEKYIQRARESANLREEMAAIKQMSIILGLAKAENEDINNDFVRMVENTARKRAETTMIDHVGPLKQGEG